MERCLLASLVVFALAPPVAVAQPVEAPIPDTMIAKSPRGTDYLWVSAKAVEAEGFGLLGPRMESFFTSDRARRKQAEQGCFPWQPDWVLRPNRRRGRTLEQWLQNSLAIYRGTVVELQPGFYRGAVSSPSMEAGTMVKVAVLEQLRSSPSFRVDEFVHVFLRSVGDFEVRGFKICAKNPNLPPSPPPVGSSLLCFPLLEPIDLDQNVILLEQGECLWEDPPGELWISSNQRDGDSTLTRARSLVEAWFLTRVGLKELEARNDAQE